MLELVSFMLLALVLGFKHSYDSDHLIAVSSILRKSDSVKASARISASWAIGHLIAAAIITIILFIFKETFFDSIFPHFEKIAGILLIILGILSLKDFFSFHSHEHSHNGIIHSHPHIHATEYNRHSHRHMFGIGIVQGLAGNDELLMLFTASLAVTSLGWLLAGVTIFSLGVVLGMVLFSLIFSFPLIKLNSDKAYRLVSFGTGTAGLAYGALMLFAIV